MDAREDTVGDYEDEGARGWSFRDRKDAGQQLARALSEYRGQEALVLGIPRGGVPVAYEIACSLDAELDVIVARKIGAPGQEEFGIGAIAADGTLVINEDMRAYVHISEPELEQRTQEQSAEAQRREHRFRVGLPALSPAGRLVIVVDDGLATGATLRAAVRSLQRRGAERLVVAVPVGAPEACTRISARGRPSDLPAAAGTVLRGGSALSRIRPEQRRRGAAAVAPTTRGQKAELTPVTTLVSTP